MLSRPNRQTLVQKWLTLVLLAVTFLLSRLLILLVGPVTRGSEFGLIPAQTLELPEPVHKIPLLQHVENVVSDFLLSQDFTFGLV